MIMHEVPMPAHPQPWECSCGTTAPLPLACTWVAWDTSVAAHMPPPPPGQWHCDWCGCYAAGHHPACTRCGHDTQRTTNGKKAP